LAEPLIDPLD